MKNVTNISKRVLSTLLVCILLFAVVNGVPMKVEAASYPILIAEDYKIVAVKGNVVPLTYHYMPVYKNERLCTRIYDSYGNLVATADQDFYNSSIGSREYTVNFWTDDFSAGTYKVVTTAEFYTYYEWHESPRSEVTYVTLIRESDRKSLEKAKVSGISTKAYTGKAVKQKIKVKLNGKTLTKDVDYTVSYKNNKKTGKATIKIKGKGYYKGTITKEFYICPKKSKINSVESAKKKQLTVDWKKDSQATGYQILIATNKDFTKNKDAVTVKNNKTTSKTIKKLKSGKTYYVKVRAYKTIGGKKVYGSYSKVEKIKVR